MKPQGANLQSSHFKNNLPFANGQDAYRSHWLYTALKISSLFWLLPACILLAAALSCWGRGQYREGHSEVLSFNWHINRGSWGETEL